MKSTLNNPATIIRKSFITTVIVIATVAVFLQVFVSYETLSSQQGAYLTNEAGRQRVLSQRIAKHLLQTLYAENNETRQQGYVDSITKDIAQIKTNQQLLINHHIFNQRDELLKKTNESIKVLEKSVNQALKSLESSTIDISKLRDAVELYLTEEEKTLKLMDQTALIAVEVTEQKMIEFLWYSWAGTLFILLSLMVSTRKVLYPALDLVKKLFKKLQENNINLEKSTQQSEKNEQAIGEQAVKLLAHKHLHEAILNTTQAVIITINPKGCITVFNNAAETLFGFKKHEVTGKNIKLLMPNPYKDEHDGYLDNYLTTGIKKIIDIEREVVGQKKDGSVFPMNLRVKEINLQGHHEFIGFVEDLSDKQQVEQTKKELAQSESLYLSVVDDQDNLICRYNKDFILTFVNKAYCEYFSKGREELLGISLLTLLPDEIVDWFKRTHQSITYDQPTQQHEDKVICPDGREEWQAWTTRGIFTDKKQIVEFQGVGTVTTSRKISEFEILKAKRIAEEANKAKSLFLSNMSHELRTPLNSIIGFSQILEIDDEEPLTKLQRESVELIYKGGIHLLGLINDILDLSTVEAGKMNVSLEPIALQDIFDEVFSYINEMASKRGVTINVQNNCVDERVIADYLRVKQVMLNLLSNAIKYNHKNGHIDIEVSKKTPKILISIKDTGPGICKEKQKGLFIPFNRLGAEKTAIEGTGIGLSLCKSIVEQLRGEIGVQSEPGFGCDFWFTLPLADNAAKNIIAEDIKMPDEMGIKLLYIEDNPANMQLMRRVIKRVEGVVLFDAPSAEIGLEMIEHMPPDIVLLDIDLPGMNGYQAYMEIQKFDFSDEIPIIAITANAMKKDIEKGKELGFYEYLTKPLDISFFIKTLNKVILEIKKQ